jgi:hypothetical protein
VHPWRRFRKSITMSDFDEYFPDDIILDEKAIAMLDAEEKKFKQSQQHPRPQQPVPLPKRQKTEHGWKHARPAPASQSDNFDEDLPEISIHDDGSYGILGAQPNGPNTLRTSTTSHSVSRSQTRQRLPNLATRPASAGPSNSVRNYQPQVQRRNSPSLSQSSRNVQVSSQNSSSNLQKKQSGLSNSSQAALQRTARSSAPERSTTDDVSALRLRLQEVCHTALS